MLLTIFLYLSAFRIISGAQNGAIYAKNQRRLTQVSGVMTALLASAIVSAIAYQHNAWWGLASIGACLVSLIGTWGVENSFSRRLEWVPKDIHFWEMLATGGVVFAALLSGLPIIAIVCSVYPSLIIHKGLINLGGGNPFFYHGTDDPTGKTFSLLGWKILRMGTKGRITVAVFSLIGLGVALWRGWDFGLFDLI